MKLKSNLVKKAMIFAGDQFTWGQGLHYYSNLSSIKIPEYWKFDRSLLTSTHLKFIEKYRFARLVADHFDTVEFVREPNYASNELIIDWFESSFSNNKIVKEDFFVPNIRYEEIGILFFQMTRLERDRITLTVNDVSKFDTIESFIEVHKDFLKQYLDMHNLKLEEWHNQILQDCISRVKLFLQNCENKGINIILSTWPIENINYIKNDSYLNSKLLPITYKNNTYYAFTDLAGDTRYGGVPNSELILSHDMDNFLEGPKDIHFSKLGHRIIAENIIKYIEDKKWL
jgi:hypothetical protein